VITVFGVADGCMYVVSSISGGRCLCVCGLRYEAEIYIIRYYEIIRTSKALDSDKRSRNL
jgi:hypothetical protein